MPFGSVSNQSSSSRSENAFCSTASVASGDAKRRLYAIVSANKNGSCGTTINLRLKSAFSTRVKPTPPNKTFPRVGSANLAISRASVVFPDPDGPTNAMCCPPGTCKLIELSTGVSSSTSSSRDPYAKLTSTKSIDNAPFGSRVGEEG